MSSQHKLYNYQVAPPAEAWERIAQELDGVNEFRNVSQKLQNLQVAPPAFAWEKISGELDDQQSFDIIAKKLSAVAVAPPADIWRKIETELDAVRTTIKKKPAVVIPMRARIRRYATAAAVFGMIGLAAFFMVQRSSRDAEQIQAQLDKSEPAVIQPAQVVVQDPQAAAVKSKTIVSDSNPVNAGPPTMFATNGAPADVVTTSNGNAYTTTVEKNHEMDGRYIVLMTEEGNVVRMSKKVSSMADCIAGEDNSSECTNQIAAWQKEVANMPVLASPDNILGLLELATKGSPGAGL